VWLQLLCQPELLGDYLWAFLQPLAAAAPLMLPARRPALRQAADAVVAYLGAAFAAAPDLSAVEGNAANPEQRLARVGIDKSAARPPRPSTTHTHPAAVPLPRCPDRRPPAICLSCGS
jgi:hypothetical protein